jgi:hypothetical protein
MNCLVLSSVCLGLLLQTGCAGMRGKIADAKYVAPNNLFSCELPWPRDEIVRIEDQVQGNAVMVRFFRKFEGFRRIDTQPLSVQAVADQGSVDRQTFLEAYFHAEVLPKLKHTIPNTELIASEFLSDLQDGSLYLLMRLPEKSNVWSGLRQSDGTIRMGYLDAIRGFLLFLQTPYIFIVQAEQGEVYLPDRKDLGAQAILETPEHRAHVKKHTIGFARGIRVLP